MFRYGYVHVICMYMIQMHMYMLRVRERENLGQSVAEFLGMSGIVASNGNNLGAHLREQPPTRHSWLRLRLLLLLLPSSSSIYQRSLTNTYIHAYIHTYIHVSDVIKLHTWMNLLLHSSDHSCMCMHLSYRLTSPCMHTHLMLHP